MMSKEDWKKVIDETMTGVGAASSGGQLYTAIQDYHKNPYNKKLNIYMKCGSCASAIYFFVTRVASNHWTKGSTPPKISCNKCGYSGDHEYKNVVYSQ